MREIKFRVWDYKLKTMGRCIGISHYEMIEPCGNVTYYSGDKTSLQPVNSERVEIMQYTGINDRNDKEIYKGDIVKRKSLVFGSIDIIGTVKMLEGCWVIDNGKEAVNLWTECDENEVLGNIHENPELSEK